MDERITRFQGTPGSDEFERRLDQMVHPADVAKRTHVVGSVSFTPFVMPSLLLRPEGHYVAFFDPDRWLTVAYRSTWGDSWCRVRLDSRLAWDSHNYAALGIDRSGNLHLAANMHASPLVYFRTARPGDISSFVRYDFMVQGNDEGALTYPKFFADGSGALTFWFRSGVSGAGVQRYYEWVDRSSVWIDSIGGALIDGEGVRSPYPDLYQPHRVEERHNAMTWVWRDSPDAESTHTICYATSDRFDAWRNADGAPLDLPIRFGSDAEVGEWGVGRGLINNNVRIGHSASGMPVIVFHVRDEAGRLQLVSLRYQSGWIRRVITEWDVVWDFGGRGSLRFDLEIGVPLVTDAGYHVDVRYMDEVVRVFHDLTSDEVSTLAAIPPWNGLTMVGDGASVRGIQHSQSGGGFLTWLSSPPDRDKPQTNSPQQEPSSLVLLRYLDGNTA